jgi:hypothetical protein
MKQINIDYIFKIIILFFSAYLLFILTIIAINLENGRYQSTTPGISLDTKTGKFYHSPIEKRQN